MRRIRSLVKALAVAAILTAAFHPANAAGELLRDFQLLLGEVSVNHHEAQVGDVVRATVSLMNIGPQSLDLCFGSGHFYRFFGTRSSDDRLMERGVARCVSRVLLGPGQAATVVLTIEVPDVGNGAASLFFLVQLVDPTTCDETGCSAVMFPTRAVQLSIHGGTDPRPRPSRTTAIACSDLRPPERRLTERQPLC